MKFSQLCLGRITPRKREREGRKEGRERKRKKEKRVGEALQVIMI
jgi:hypothetical protein